MLDGPRSVGAAPAGRTGPRRRGGRDRRLIGGGAALLLALLAPPAPANQPPTRSAVSARVFVEQAERCLAAGDVVCAATQAQKARATDARDAEARRVLGLALLAGGNARAASAELAQALDLGADRGAVAPSLARSWRLDGQPQRVLDDPRVRTDGLAGHVGATLAAEHAAAAEALGRGPEALRRLAQAQAAEPQAVAWWLAEASLHLGRRDLAAAQRALARAEALQPDAPEVLLLQGQALALKGDTAGARARWDRLLAAQPRHAEARIARAGLLVRLGLTREAEQDLAALDAADQQDPRALLAVAQLADRLGRSAVRQQALRRIVQAIDAQPPAQLRALPDMLLINGLAHAALGEREPATAYLALYREVHGDTPASRGLAQLYLQQRQPEQAQAVLRGLLQRSPQDSEALALLARSQAQQGQVGDAIALLQAALRRQDQADLQVALAEGLLKAGRAGEAASAFLAALRQAPRHPAALRGLADLRLAQGDAAQAQRLVDTLLAAEPEPAVNHVLAGRVQQRLGALPVAQAAFERALQREPGQAAALLGLAEVALARRDWAALERQVGALAQRPGLAADAALLQAQALEAQGRAAEAATLLDSAAAQAADGERRPLIALCELQLRRGQPAAATACAERLVQRAPGDFAARIFAARAWLGSGAAEPARAQLRQAAELAGTWPAAAWIAAHWQLQAGDAASAADTLDRALRAAPQDADLLLLRARADLQQGRLDAADAAAQRLARAQPKDPAPKLLQAEAAMARGRGRAAVEALRQAHALAPDTQTAMRLFLALTTVDGPPAGLAWLQQWLQRQPDDLVARTALGDACVGLGRWAEARAAFEGVLQRAPSAAAVRNNLAYVLVQLKDPGALAMAEQALAQGGPRAEVLDTAALAALEARQPAKAVGWAREAVRLQPADPSLRWRLASALAAQGQAAEARSTLEPLMADARPFPEREQARALLAQLTTAR